MADAERPIAQSPKSSREMPARDVDFDSKSAVICSHRFTFAQFRDLSPHEIFTPFTFAGE